MIFKNLKKSIAVIGLFSLGFTACKTHKMNMKTQVNSFTELPDPTLDTLSDWSSTPAGLQASFVTIDKRYPKSILPLVEMQSVENVMGWKGERVSAQLLLWTTEDLSQVEVAFSKFSSNGKSLPASIAQARFVRYVITDEFRAGCGYRKPEDFAASLSPDMLDDVSQFNLEAKKARPVWVTIEIPSDAIAGDYQTQIEIKANGKKLKSFQLNLKVIDQVLPKSTEWTFHLDQWQHPSAVARVAGVEMWSDEHFEALKPVMQLLVDAGQKVITTTLNKDPWNVQTFDPYADMITWTKNEDGSWTYDYAVFDRWVHFRMDLGVNKMISAYSIIPWNNEIHYQDSKSGKLINVVAEPGTPVFTEMWKPFLTDFAKHLKSKGWLEITNIAMDERDNKSMDAAFSLIESIAPELGVSFADNQKTYKKYPNSADISVAVNHPFDQVDLEDRRRRGLNTTFYVSCADIFPNQFTFSDPAESTYLAWYAMASGFDGLLRWAFNSWVENPIQDSRFRTWPAGDTYIVYPGGRSSIRYERMLEGIQDYEKTVILKSQLKANGHNQAIAMLEKVILKLKNTDRRQNWNIELNEAKQLLNELSSRSRN